MCYEHVILNCFAFIESAPAPISYLLSIRLMPVSRTHKTAPSEGRAGCYVQVSDPSCSDYDKRTPL